ncbi:N-6 DNA methylase [Corynebacterium sp. TA-R-1]|uniref:site-specific DNA-methyltransferase (adenine-specific) n=1 Tax=Corynebacterium stercoris TaxID=2943490 RepID=A0ABT1G2U7_9CORY|nr:DNA methyltransferase [Corynebacterium stercoris]MCP1387047.1 N-6 DNA methylase [Corynebacterium stercoris]
MPNASSQSRSFARKQQAANDFAARWKGRGYEKGDTSSFWLELLRDVVGMEDVTTNVRFEQRTTAGGFIDVVVPDAKTFIEQKSLGIDLDKADLRQGKAVTPFQQAREYANSLPNSQRPDYIVVSNFSDFRIHDLNKLNPEVDYLAFSLSELSDQLHLLDFLVDPQRARAIREEKASMDAGVLIGSLYRMLREQFHDPDAPENQHSLNVLCVRLVFCLFAEDAGVFPKDAFFSYLHGAPAHLVRGMLKDLFRTLNTPPAERDPYLDERLRVFPYVNGGLFAQEEEVPPFTQDILDALLFDVSQNTNWAEISPTIFGGVFESTLNPETRASGGMHYTSPANIHKVIDPLFMDTLTAELESILTEEGVSENRRRTKLSRFHDKIAGLTFFDPACGSGNFLTETYVSLRRMENKVISELSKGQTSLGFEDLTPLKINLDQFFGIEINDFAVSVAQTALWIAKLQANIEAQTIVTHDIQDLPLVDAPSIRRGNALTLDWNSVLPAERCNYIIGNPPFLGARNQSKEQKEDLIQAFPAGTKNVGNIDYVAGWYIKAAGYMADHPTRAAFVSTNSICQGEQVANIWHPILQMGFHIDFAHNTFRWANESADQAHVFCVIVGFSRQADEVRLFHYAHPDAEPKLQHPSRLNPYLVDAPDALVWSRSKPLCDVPRIGIGNKPIDGGNYLFTDAEKEEFIQLEPLAEKYFKPWLGSIEFLQGKSRWVLWLGDAQPQELAKMPHAMERVRAVKEFRESSRSATTRKIADRPRRFHVENMPSGNSILIPKVSSERRRYIPIGFVGPETLCSDLVFLIPNATLYHFGILQSQFHNAWMRRVAGRLKSDYRYSGGVVYNNFVWPKPCKDSESEISRCAQAVLDARAQYSGITLAHMYDPSNDFLYPELVDAHRTLDTAVEEAFELESNGDEQEIVNHLFNLYSVKVGAI